MNNVLLSKNISSNSYPQRDSLLKLLEAEILSLPREGMRQNSEVCFSFMKKIKNSNLPYYLLKEVLSNSNLLAEVAARSYEHINHFDKIVLVDNPKSDGFRLTMHCWYGDYNEVTLNQELVHNHRFSFWSYIYKGTLISENFREAENSSIEKKTFKRYVYYPSETGNIHSCTFDKEAQLIKIGTDRHPAGTIYHLNYKTTHRVVLPDQNSLLCTFVLRGPREQEHTHTYNTFYPDRGIASKIPMMTPMVLQNKLLRIMEEK